MRGDVLKRDGGTRQFMELGPLTNTDTDANSAAIGSSENKDDRNKGDSPSQGWISNKLPKLTESTTNPIVIGAAEQAKDATMRKARVSVRARSDAPMVLSLTNSILNYS